MKHEPRSSLRETYARAGTIATRTQTAVSGYSEPSARRARARHDPVAFDTQALLLSNRLSADACIKRPRPVGRSVHQSGVRHVRDGEHLPVGLAHELLDVLSVSQLTWREVAPLWHTQLFQLVARGTELSFCLADRAPVTGVGLN